MKVATGFGVAALFYLVRLIARTEASCPNGQYEPTGCIGIAHNFGGRCSTPSSSFNNARIKFKLSATCLKYKDSTFDEGTKSSDPLITNVCNLAYYGDNGKVLDNPVYTRWTTQRRRRRSSSSKLATKWFGSCKRGSKCSSCLNSKVLSRVDMSQIARGSKCGLNEESDDNDKANCWDSLECGYPAKTTGCRDCPAGYYCTRGRRSVCAAGKYSLPKATSCKTCPKHYFCPGGARVPCPAGKFSDSLSNRYENQCQPCLAGKYCLPGVGPKECPQGKYSNLNLATSLSSCISCSPGTFCPDGRTRQPCPRGKFSATGQALCSPCPESTFCPGGSTFQSCPRGRFTASGSSSARTSAVDCELAVPLAAKRSLSLQFDPFHTTVGPTKFEARLVSTSGDNLCGPGTYKASGLLVSKFPFSKSTKFLLSPTVKPATLLGYNKAPPSPAAATPSPLPTPTPVPTPGSSAGGGSSGGGPVTGCLADPCGCAVGLTDFDLTPNCVRVSNIYGDVGFKLSRFNSILRFGGFSWDDNNVDAGSNQPRNVCVLAMYGNLPASIPARPNARSFAKAAGPNSLHYYGNCKAPTCLYTPGGSTGCINNGLVAPGTDFLEFSTGNTCGSDSDTDKSWTELSCFFDEADLDALSRGMSPSLSPEPSPIPSPSPSSTPPATPAPAPTPSSASSGTITPCDPTDMCACKLKLGSWAFDNHVTCGQVTSGNYVGFTLTASTITPLTFNGYSFDDNRVETGENQPRNVCILAMYGNKPSQIPAIPTTSSFAKANGQNMRHYFGNCATSSGCTGCLNNKLVTVGTDFQTFSLGNNCNSDLDKDQSWTELTCIFEKSQIENLHSTWRSSRRLDEKVEAKKEHKAGWQVRSRHLAVPTTPTSIITANQQKLQPIEKDNSGWPFNLGIINFTACMGISGEAVKKFADIVESHNSVNTPSLGYGVIYEANHRASPAMSYVFPSSYPLGSVSRSIECKAAMEGHPGTGFRDFFFAGMGTALVAGDPDFHLMLKEWRGSTVGAPNCSTTASATVITRLQSGSDLEELKSCCFASSASTTLQSAAPMCRLNTSSLPSDAIVVYAGDDGFADVVVFPPQSVLTMTLTGAGAGGHIVYVSNTFLESPQEEWRALFMDLMKMLAIRQTSGWTPSVQFSRNAGTCVTCPAGSFCTEGQLQQCNRGSLPADDGEYGQYYESCIECGGAAGSNDEKLCMGGARDAVPCNPGPLPNIWLWGLPRAARIFDQIMAVNPEGIDAAPLPDQTAVMSYFSSNGNDNRSKALGIALGIGMHEDRVAQGSLRKCAKKLGLIAEGQYTQEEYFDVRDPDVSWGTVEIRNIVAEALSVMGEGYISGKETVSERKTNLKRLDQEQLRLICKRHESNNLLFFLGPSNGFGEQYPWPHSMYATSRTFWEFSLTRALGLLVGNITYLRDPASPNSIVAQGRPMVFSGGYTNLMLMKYMFADVWEVRNLSKFSGIERRPGWFEPKYLNSSQWNGYSEWARSFSTFASGVYNGAYVQSFQYKWNSGKTSGRTDSYEWFIPGNNGVGEIYKDDPQGYFPASPDSIRIWSRQHWPIKRSILPPESYVLYGDSDFAHVVYFERQNVLYLSWGFQDVPQSGVSGWIDILKEFRSKHARRARCCAKGSYKKREGASIARAEHGDTAALETRSNVTSFFGSWSGTGAWNMFNTCPSCPRGSICPDGDEVQVCPRGSVNLLEGQTDPSACSICPAGTIASGGPSKECTECLRGSMAPLPMSLQCTLCRKGTYAKFNGSDRCRPCDFGTWHNNVGMFEKGECKLSGGYVAAAVIGSISCFVIILYLASVAFPKYYDRIKEKMLALERRRGEDIVDRARERTTSEVELVQGSGGRKAAGGGISPEQMEFVIENRVSFDIPSTFSGGNLDYSAPAERHLEERRRQGSVFI